jgi:histidine triad (HIT) family protein
MNECIFCRIARGEIPVKFIHESDNALAFNDIDPKAPVHVLIIPRRHYSTTITMADDAPELYGELFRAAAAVARKTGVDESGFRLMLNTNADGGQEIFHVHMHLLGGEPIGPMRCR